MDDDISITIIHKTAELTAALRGKEFDLVIPPYHKAHGRWFCVIPVDMPEMLYKDDGGILSMGKGGVADNPYVVLYGNFLDDWIITYYTKKDAALDDVRKYLIDGLGMIPRNYPPKFARAVKEASNEVAT